MFFPRVNYVSHTPRTSCSYNKWPFLFWSSSFCPNIHPIEISCTVKIKINGCLGLGGTRIGGLRRHSFTQSNGSWYSLFHSKGLFVLNNLSMGLHVGLSWAINRLKSYTRLIKLLTSVSICGVGMFVIALTFIGSTSIPLKLTVKPTFSL